MNRSSLAFFMALVFGYFQFQISINRGSFLLHGIWLAFGFRSGSQVALSLQRLAGMIHLPFQLASCERDSGGARCAFYVNSIALKNPQKCSKQSVLHEDLLLSALLVKMVEMPPRPASARETRQPAVHIDIALTGLNVTPCERGLIDGKAREG